MSVMNSRWLALLLSAVLVMFLQLPAAQQGGPAFDGNYPQLPPLQKRLVDDWFERFSKVVKKPVNPEEAFEKLPLSTKTTFNAVTHALSRTTLTDSSGKKLADSALSLVDKVDQVSGEILGAKGDEQFRIYVQLKPGAFDMLKKSREFRHTRDNTVYHKGYPTCFRSNKGTPSIQFSLTPAGDRADIDVDYRSSKFPVFLINGHLSASNSDVRVGNNDDRHNQQWSGLQNWWRNLLGLPIGDGNGLSVQGEVLASTPKKGKGGPAEAVHDFLNGWLVEQQPNESIAYFDTEVVDCIEISRGVKVDRGMAKFALLQRMQEVNRRVGKISSVGEVLAQASISGERLKVISQPFDSEFTLYKVREDLAEEFRCANKLDSTQISSKAAKSKNFDKYLAAVFAPRRPGETGKVVASLWEKKQGYWKVISFYSDPELDRSNAPSVHTAPPPPAPLEYVEGDRDMVKAASDFMTQWLVKKNIDKALSFVAPECLNCVGIYADEDQPAPSSPEASRALLKAGMARAADARGSVKKLDSAIVAVRPQLNILKLVKHDRDGAFAIVAIPDSLGEASACDKRGSDGQPHFRVATGSPYGNFYAVGFHMNGGEGDASLIWMIWRKSGDAWKVVSYVLDVP